MSDEPTNLPGQGAEALARRAARRAARLREDQAMGRGADSAVEEQLRQAVRRQRTYSQGAEGERLVAQTLGFLERYGWVALHDVHWPGRPQANIDHIAVGPGGIVVIDAKNWTGDVAVKEGALRQNGYSRARETSAAADATSAVTSRVPPQHRAATSAVLCLVAHDMEPVCVGQTTVIGRSALAEHLVALPVRLTAYDVADVARLLADDLAGDRSPTVLTSGDIDARTGAPRSSLREYREKRTAAWRGTAPAPPAHRPARSSPARPRGRVTPRGHGAGSRVRRVLGRLALLFVLLAFAPGIVAAIAERVVSGVASNLTPSPAPPAPSTVPDPTEVPPALPVP